MRSRWFIILSHPKVSKPHRHSVVLGGGRVSKMWMVRVRVGCVKQQAMVFLNRQGGIVLARVLWWGIASVPVLRHALCRSESCYGHGVVGCALMCRYNENSNDSAMQTDMIEHAAF